MEKYIIDEKNGFEYKLIGNHYYPTGRRMNGGALIPSERPEESPAEAEVFIGPWAQRHLKFIKEHRPGFYLDLFTTGKADTYLTEIERDATGLFLRLVKEMSEQEGVTERMKAENQMLWIQRMNSIRERASEIVNNELIYT